MADPISRKNKKYGAFGKGVIALVSAGVLAAGGLAISTHYSLKNDAIETVSSEMKSREEGYAQQLNQSKAVIDSVNQQKKTIEEKLEETQVVAEQRARQIKIERGRIEAEKLAIKRAYEDSLETVADKQYLAYDVELRNFLWDSNEMGRNNKIYVLSITPLNVESTRERVDRIIPKNVKEREEYDGNVKGFFSKYNGLAKKQGLKPLIDYESVAAIPKSDNTFDLIFTDRKDNSKTTVKGYYPGAN